MSISSSLNNGILTLTMDMPGLKANVLNDSLTQPFAEHLDAIVSDEKVRGVILTSAKSGFLAGADIDGLYAIKTPEAAMALTENFKRLLRTMETCGKPVVAALNGTALGGGLELALACHYRVAINNPKAKFGLPEVKLGLLPGGGGTQRLSRLIGIQPSLPLMLEGKELSAAAAHQAGIIDDLVDDNEAMIAAAVQWIEANPNAMQPWDKKGFRWPGGDSKAPKNGQAMSIAPAMINKKARGNFPAPINILSCVAEGGLVNFDAGCALESRYFANCVMSPQSRNMINTFWYQMNALNKGQSRPDVAERFTVKKVGILGAGMMGAGIAYVSAKAGIEVVLKDVSQAGADQGKAYSENLLQKAVSRGRTTQDKANALLAMITATDNVDDMADCDLIIEAVFEDQNLKAKVTQETEAVLQEGAVFASNTSTLPITDLAKASRDDSKFIGLHFFSPVDRMPLVEIIKGENTSDETLARGFDYVQQIRKTPIVVNDSRGFYTSRVFGFYVGEGLALLAEGQHPRAIESAGLEAGMPVGPLALNDEVSISLSLHILEEAIKAAAEDGREFKHHPADAVVRKMAGELDRPGKKAGKGFYDYPTDGQKTLWAGLTQHFPLAAEQLPLEVMQERILLAQANETVRCLEEGVLESATDANIGSIFGWGYAPWTGGTLQYLNSYGLDKAVARLEEFAERFGERFVPAQLLKDMAASGKEFT